MSLVEIHELLQKNFGTEGEYGGYSTDQASTMLSAYNTTMQTLLIDQGQGHASSDARTDPIELAKAIDKRIQENPAYIGIKNDGITGQDVVELVNVLSETERKQLARLLPEKAYTGQIITEPDEEETQAMTAVL